MLEIRNLKIANPIWIASGPLTNSPGLLRQAEESGAGAASLKLTFLREPFEGKLRTYSVPGRMLIAPVDKRMAIVEGLELAREVKNQVRIPVFANLGAAGRRLDEWIKLATSFEEAGVDGLELNFCCPNLDTDTPDAARKHEHGGQQISQNPEQCGRITSAVRKNTDLPVVCKLVPNALDPISAVQACEHGGADAIHVVGLPAAGLPDVDIETSGRPLIRLTEKASFGAMNGPVCLHSTYMAAAQCASCVKIPVIASGGISTWEDCVNTLMWGASAVAVCTAVMWYGFEVVRTMREGLEQFFERRGLNSWLDLSGKSLQYLTTPDRLGIEDGRAVVDEAVCTGCGKCAKPGHCTAISLDKVRKYAVIEPKHCVGCGICISLCPVKALKLM